jgi:hypothetical protein
MDPLQLEQRLQNLCELDLLHKIGRHVANDDTFDETPRARSNLPLGW